MKTPQVLSKSLIFLLTGLTCLYLTISSHATSNEPLIDHGGYMVVSASGETLASYNSQDPFIPASIFKVITALQAIETLGQSYSFPTYFFISPGIDLYIVGSGDPLLISEKVDIIAQALKKRGLKRVRNIYIDNSKYDLNFTTINDSITQNPYDTALSAVAVNFNTIQIKVSETAGIRSGEPQTPTLPIMKVKGHGLGLGLHRINLGADGKDLMEYAGQLFKAALEKAGIQTTGDIQEQVTPSKAGLFYTYHSPPLNDLLRPMLLYSNNFMANQIYLKNGVKKYGYPTRWTKATKAMQSYLQGGNLESEDLKIVDGAGLSADNRITCQTMIAILQGFRPYLELLPLKNGIPVKSGTMTGVYSYAGYLGTSKDAPAFVLILNQKDNNREQLLKRLLAQFGPASSTTNDSK